MRVGDRIAGRYELEELLGEGGMASVYRAYDAVLERRVAIKVLHERLSHDPQYVERFRREARAIARLAHPNIVTVIDRGEWEGRQFIVFEHVAGESLKSVVERAGPLPVGRALELAHQIGRALAFAHDLGFVHRDVKPHNVLVDPDGTPKVTDFGIARALDVDDAITETGTMLGSGHYAAPEQASGEPAGEAADQYSLGVVLYELLVGEVPFSGENVMAVAMRHLTEPAPSVRDRRPDVPARVDEIVRRLLAKRPEERYPSMDAAVAALEACLAGAGGPATPAWDAADQTSVLPAARPAPTGPEAPPAAPVRPEPPPSRPRRRLRASLVVVPLLAVALVAGGLVALEVLLGSDVPVLPGDGDGGGGGGGGDADGETSVELRAVSDYDPEGGDGEHPEAVASATDGDPTTYWTTETYSAFTKSGVGIVLDAGDPVALARLTVTTDTPGFTAVIMSGERRGGPFEPVSEELEAGRSTDFELDGPERRFYLLWITGLDSVAHVNEARGFEAR